MSICQMRHVDLPFGFQSMSFLGLVGVEDKKYDSCALQQDVGKIEILIHDTESWLYKDV